MKKDGNRSPGIVFLDIDGVVLPIGACQDIEVGLVRSNPHAHLDLLVSRVPAPPVELLNSLLYYVARANSADPRIEALRKKYKLGEMLPGELQIEQAQERLAGPSVKLMRTVAQAIKGWKSEGLEAGLIYWKAQALAQKLRGELATTFAERAALTFSSPNKLLKGKSIASWLVGIVRDSPDGLTAFRAAGAKFKFLTKKNGGSLVGMEKIFDVLKPLADEGYSAARLEALTTELLVGLTAGVRPGQGFTAIQEILTDLTAAKMAHVPGVLEDAGVADPAAIERIRGFADNLCP